jgi:hypothetical protein
LGVIVGFVVWSIVWVGGEALLAKVSPDWLGAYSLAAEKALVNGTELALDPAIAAIHLVRSFITSIIAGYMAALAAGEYKRSTLILGILLVLVGVAVEYMTLAIAPLWYHILFVIFLIPMTMLGGKLRRPS